MIRILAVFILLFGVAQAGSGIWFVSSVDQVAQLLATAKSAGEPILREFDIVVWKSTVLLISIAFLVTGSATVVSGFGVFYFREWARKLWLAVISFLLVFEGVWFLSDVLRGYVRLDNWIELFFFVAICGASWGYFTRSRVRQRFLLTEHT
jgi:hypothetical protein